MACQSKNEANPNLQDVKRIRAWGRAKFVMFLPLRGFS